MKLLLVVLSSYLIGSIPFSYLSSKLKGKDPRLAGTKNIGASNVLVVAGPLFGFLALVGDIAKGFVVVLLAKNFVGGDLAIVLAGLAAIAGHDFSIFLKFQGGKGVATTGGILLALDPIFFVIILLLWILTMVVTRYFILSTLIMYVVLPVALWLAWGKISYVFFAIGAALLTYLRHWDDLLRIISGNELTIPEAMSKYLK